MKRIYLAGPMGKDPQRRREHCVAAAKVALGLVAYGYAVYCPQLWDFAEGADCLAVDRWLSQDLRWISACDAVVRLLGDSPGADAEVAWANATGIPVVLILPDASMGDAADQAHRRLVELAR